VNVYMPQMMTTLSSWPRSITLASTNYAGNSGGAATAIASSAYPNRNFWITEVWNPDDIIRHIGQTCGRPGMGCVWTASTTTGFLAGRGTHSAEDNVQDFRRSRTHDDGVYTPRDTFYQDAQIFKYVPKG